MQKGDLLVQDLREDVDANLFLTRLTKLNVSLPELFILGFEQHDLGQDLVGERTRHDKGRVTGCTAKVDKTAFGEEDDVTAILHEVAVDLWFNILDGFGIGFQPGDVDFNVEVTDIANNGVVLHDFEMFACEDISAAGRRDEDLADWGCLLHGGHLIARDGCLECVDGIDLGDDDASAHAVKSLSATLADVTEAGDDSDFAGDHDVCCALDAVDERLSAAVEIVKFGLGNGVVDVDGGYEELLVLEQSVQMVNASGCLLRDTVAVLEHIRVFVVNESCQVPTVVEDQI